MNTNALKKFAREARIKIVSQVAAKLEYVLTTDSAVLREKEAQVKKLKAEIQKTSKEQVVDKVAYTWFNRLMALRFMDANDYQPIKIGVVTPKDGYTLPELLDEAKQGNIPDELLVDTKHIFELLDGTIRSSDAQNEAYKELLIGACNHLNTIFPFLFEKINDYAELLLPDDLTSEFSIVQDIRDGMSTEDCAEVEIIGWLYQFYISEVNERLISSKKKYRKQDLAPASQLFTPKWIVQYMVDNTLGQVWAEINPNTKVLESLEYYIKPSYPLQDRKQKSIEDIKFFEPCVGSGHILSYAFDVFYKMYEEQGYNPSEIPQLIIEKNLFGVDIDPRAAQLASFVLMMKGRQKHRRFLRAVEKNSLQTNISFYQDFEFDEKFSNATALGSLIQVTEEEANAYKVDETSLFGDRQKEVKKLYKLLGQKYDVVVTNPPYISSSRMEGSLKQFVETNYPETKSDLFATFILRCLELCDGDGLTGYMTPFVWMFISSYEKLRGEIIAKHFINNLIQLEYSGFDGATVPICTFTLRRLNIDNAKGSYIRLSDFKGSQNQAPKTLEAIQNKDCGWFYRANQRDFDKIPGNSIGFWASDSSINSFASFNGLGEKFNVKSGVMTGNDNRFLRYWYELNHFNIALNKSSLKELDYSKEKYLPMNKEEGFRKWIGRYKTVFRYDRNGENFNNVEGLNYRLRDNKYYFKKGISWGDVTSSKTSYRYQESGLVFSARAPMIITDNKQLVGLLNSKLVSYLQEILNPTLSFNLIDLERIPVHNSLNSDTGLDEKVSICLNISSKEWKTNILSIDFEVNELIRINGQDIEEAYDSYCHYWQNKFMELHKNEEALNKQFIDIYGLQDELTPDVPLEDITILKEETDIVNGELVFDAKEVLIQFISYAVGCMFGRYSLDKEGLILANQGETLEDYLEKVALSADEVSFLPDDDNIIPVLDDEWFEDDIVGRFYEFLKVTFGESQFEKNLAFVEDCIGKDIRKFFVKDFYNDHIKRYKKRPIYWMFSSPKGAFNVLIYMHRYTPDTLNQILNGYLVEYREKLNTRMEHLDHLIESGSSSEQTKAAKEKDRLKSVLIELQEYEREVLYPLATERIAIDLDDGVLVNYNKFGNAIKLVKGLNDKKAKEKVMKFDWIDTTTIK
ncbi:MAG: SAM-dependent methyltransferase [Flavobacteriaceae bacterium]|nr:SAM-dependent methyltransferase [Flavobacteriaceae bacterium]|tara:strand:- start:62673 stop:66095 length:3423 start_codon:yes stop_codon:yes gene_type:complete